MVPASRASQGQRTSLNHQETVFPEGSESVQVYSNSNLNAYLLQPLKKIW